jgi:hypothetical protein
MKIVARIEGEVAEILTGRELVINRGSLDGVSTGMRFAILNSKGTDIKDPVTKKSLGSIELEKTVVKIVRVQEHLAVGRTFRTYRTGDNIGLFSYLNQQPRTVVEDLKTDSRRLKEELDESESYVKIGDRAVQYTGEEFADA